MFTRSAITSPEVNGFRWNLGNSEYIVWSWPWQILGAIRAEARVGDLAEVLFFLSGKQRTTLPISGQPNFTKFAHKTWFCEVVNPFGIFFFENLPLRGLFSKKPWSSSTISDFKPRFFGNDYKSWKIMTGCRAYGMLAFHPYRWNQLKVIPLDSRACKRKDLPGHWRRTQTSHYYKVIRGAAAPFGRFIIAQLGVN